MHILEHASTGATGERHVGTLWGQTEAGRPGSSKFCLLSMEYQNWIFLKKSMTIELCTLQFFLMLLCALCVKSTCLTIVLENTSSSRVAVSSAPSIENP